MGSADYMQGTRLNFKTKEGDIHFAEKQGVYPLHAISVQECLAYWSPKAGIIMCTSSHLQLGFPLTNHLL